MKIKRILSAVAALAVGAMLAVSASAAGTFTLKATGSDWTDATAPVTQDSTSVTVTWETAQATIVNPGYIAYDEAGDTAEISLYLVSLTVNGQYEIPVGRDLILPEVEGSAGLPNIWNDLGKADVVYEGDGCGLYGDGGTSITFKVDGTATNIESITYNFGSADAGDAGDAGEAGDAGDAGSDDNAETGASAGLALAAIALAGAAVVATKKNK